MLQQEEAVTEVAKSKYHRADERDHEPQLWPRRGTPRARLCADEPDPERDTVVVLV